MQPQGTAPLNAAYFTSLTAAVNGCSTCSELQELATQAIASLYESQAAYAAQLALIAPALALLQVPTSPTAAVTWIKNFITSYLTPQLAAYQKLIDKEALLVIQIASVVSSITSKAGSFTNCSISIP